MHQIGPSQIGIYAERVRPDPLHCEINAWHHILDLIYTESVRCNVFQNFIKVLSAPVGLENSNGAAEQQQISSHSNDIFPSLPDCFDITSFGDNAVLRRTTLENQANANLHLVLDSMAPCVSSDEEFYGCGLTILASKIEEHYSQVAKRLNNLPTRLIGSQAVSLARHGYRLVDSLEMLNESPALVHCRPNFAMTYQHWAETQQYIVSHRFQIHWTQAVAFHQCTDSKEVQACRTFH
jgi:hypothetical protein